MIAAAQQERIPFAIGGAFAVATYTGSWRNTKDLDLYVLPESRDRMIGLLTRLGLEDYYQTLAYDRWWIYRATADDTIVDLIWAMANHRAQIDELWMSGPEVELNGFQVKTLFKWIAPGRAAELPGWIWGRLGIAAPSAREQAEEIVKRRVDLLDTRPWFGPDREKLQPAA